MGRTELRSHCGIKGINAADLEKDARNEGGKQTIMWRATE